MKILHPTFAAVREAAGALRRGELIGLPTETVYGIAAIASNRDAVEKTFSLKNRPADNPLIVHIGSVSQIGDLAKMIPSYANFLAEKLWPGPLTLVLPKLPSVLDIVTGNLDTVAIRMPSHPVARAILEAVQAPLSAPSANSFMGLSPTRAEHISAEILAGLACVIDGGPCSVGVESTVLDCTSKVATILRHGGVSRAQIESLIGPVSVQPSAERRSPGLYRRHYSPRTPLRLVEALDSGDAGIVLNEPRNVNQVQLPNDAAAYASMLYATLFELDQLGLAEILVEIPPQTPDWAAVQDRLIKAVG